jgi:hypothetical protein
LSAHDLALISASVDYILDFCGEDIEPEDTKDLLDLSRRLDELIDAVNSEH